MMIARIRSWWKALAHRPQMEAEVETELQFHIERCAEDLVRNGMSREEALRRARMELGPISVQKEESRFSRGLRPWDDLVADLRYAFRQLRHTPAFTGTVLVVLALGIGANAAMFTVIDATLLRWLPYPHADRIVSLATSEKNGSPSWVFFADLEEWRRQAHTVDGLAYYTDDSAFLQAPGGERVLSTYRVSASLFSVLGVPPAMGRDFLPEDQAPGREHVLVLSEPVWRSLFLADPDIIGKQARLDDVAYTVIGVMPGRFFFPAVDSHPQVWTPLPITAERSKRDFSAGTYAAIARLRPGMTPSMAGAELSGIQHRLTPLYTQVLSRERGPYNVTASKYRDTLVTNARSSLLALVAAVAVLWLIACANVASLMLARSVARQREVAVRVALGASRWRVIRQLFTEGLLLSLAGATAGLALAQAALAAFSRTLSSLLTVPAHLPPNWTVLGALLFLSLLSATLFAFFPAWLSTRAPLEPALRQGLLQTGQSRGRHRIQQAMVVAEIGLSLVLLIACGLLLRTVFALRNVPVGFRTDHVLILEPKVPPSRHKGVDLNVALYRPLLNRVKEMHGVSAASLTTLVPLHKGFNSLLSLYYGAKNSGKEPVRIDAGLKAVGPELKEVLGFRMNRGRFFNQQDTADSQPVAVVNRAFADLIAAGGGTVEQLSFSLGKDRNVKIVGIMEDFHQAGLDRPSVPEIDFCASQLRPTDNFYQPVLQAHVELAIRTSEDPAHIVSDLHRVMTDLSPDLEAASIQTMDQIVEDSMGSQVLAARLLELFAGSALLVALAGLYGLLTYLVTQRTREMGVRIALGAQRHKIIEMLLGQAGRLLVAGALLGMALSYATAKVIAGFLYGVEPHDGPTLTAVTVLLVLCGLAASYLPARRASRVDPMAALRSE